MVVVVLSIDIVFVIFLPLELAVGMIAFADAFLAYFLIFNLSGKAVFSFMDAPPKRFDLLSNYRVLRVFHYCLSLLWIVSLALVYVTGNGLLRQVSSLMLSLLFMMFLHVRALSHSVNIFDKAGGIEPKKQLVNCMIGNLPILVLSFTSFWSLFTRNLGIAGLSPLFDFDIFSLLVVGSVFYVVCVGVPFSYGRRRWKQRTLAFLRRKRVELIDVTGHIARGVCSQKRVSTKRLLERISLWSELNRVGQIISEVERSPSHPRNFVVVLASAFSYIVLPLMAEPLIRLLFSIIPWS